MTQITGEVQDWIFSLMLPLVPLLWHPIITKPWLICPSNMTTVSFPAHSPGSPYCRHHHIQMRPSVWSQSSAPLSSFPAMGPDGSYRNQNPITSLSQTLYGSTSSVAPSSPRTKSEHLQVAKASQEHLGLISLLSCLYYDLSILSFWAP